VEVRDVEVEFHTNVCYAPGKKYMLIYWKAKIDFDITWHSIMPHPQLLNQIEPKFEGRIIEKTKFRLEIKLILMMRIKYSKLFKILIL
jgi:hypothetical protein